MAAIVAGYEVALRVGEALGSTHSGRFHATATAGSVGAAAATAVALGLDRTQLHHALGIAATQAAGLWQFVDDNAHESKALHPAFAVRNGMTAAYAAQAGFPGAQAFVTGKRGLYALLHGDGPLAAIDAALGETDRLCEATIKAWPTCGQLFTALDATRAIIDKWSPDAADIESVDIAIFPQALRIAGVDWPSKASETCFSGRYCVATLLLKRQLGIAETEAPDFGLPGLQVLADKTVIRAESSYADAFPHRRPCTVTVRMKDGRELTMLRDLRRGDPEDPFDWPQLEARLRAFAPTVPKAVAQQLGSWCRSFASIDPDSEFVLPAATLYGSDDEKPA
jgi:2-methylcitrate dehydratase PrpD